MLNPDFYDNIARKPRLLLPLLSFPISPTAFSSLSLPLYIASINHGDTIKYVWSSFVLLLPPFLPSFLPASVSDHLLQCHMCFSSSSSSSSDRSQKCRSWELAFEMEWVAERERKRSCRIENTRRRSVFENIGLISTILLAQEISKLGLSVMYNILFGFGAAAK